MDFTVRDYTDHNMAQILHLYDSVGWTSYTENPQMLERAFQGTRDVLGAYTEGRLVGLVRTVGDGASIIYVQDLLVHPAFQGRGIGTALLREVMTRYAHVYQKCLITDDSEKSVGFYQKNGFILHEEYGCRGLIKVY